MKTRISPHYSFADDRSARGSAAFGGEGAAEYVYEMPEGLTVRVRLTANPFGLHPDDLFRMAARINKKRSFLFVSRILGKHIPVDPHQSLLGGAALALLWQRRRAEEGAGNDKSLSAPVQDTLACSLEEVCSALRGGGEEARELYGRLKNRKLETETPTLFIAFAETATALGHAMYDCFAGDTRFLHTTREMLVGQEPVLRFEEEHSHATAHRCYAREASFFEGEDTVVLVDDEVTTGKTALNIIRDLQGKHPRRHYVVASLLDWRGVSDRERFAELEAELGITIETLSLIEGVIEVEGGPVERLPQPAPDRRESGGQQLIRHDLAPFFTHLAAVSADSAGRTSDCPYLEWTGRFGMHEADNARLDRQVLEASAYLAARRTGTRTLCMGTGEFMYVPMRIAAGMGEGVRYQSSTRSPIHVRDEEGYAVRSGFPHVSPDDPGVAHFFYNVPAGEYDEIFVFLERMPTEANLKPLLRALENTGVPVVHLAAAGAADRGIEGEGA
ncbi:phosphoribosyltransferase family protein [Saccharibacillus alkalitolerans]|uniref:Phosphoribosyltransferase n=1 Tax=Saccharibacillus alkalitolerans TaxID=2705290 RepID=A0ABX0F1U4_9BACL|nr:phosphoribosyltransferase family protein [Saccharibacillus alkalitolerans]NGZ74866.1 phosphoribosyltransferase [Saccharibacillus alkalitolerans]